MVNRNFLFKFLTLVMTFAAVLCLTACGKQGGKEAWDLFVSGVNSQDPLKIGQSLYYNQTEAEKFADGQGSEYIYTVSSIQTEEYKTTIECDFSNENKIEVYYASEVTAKVDGQKLTFTIYSYKTNNGTFLCTLPQYTADGFANTPNNVWYEKAYFTEDAYLYQIVAGKNANDPYTVTISQQNKNQKNVVIPEEINGLAVTKIGAYAFYKYNKILSFTTKNSKMKTIKLPETLLEIEKYAFYQCGKLQEIEIPNSVKTIGAYAFSSCSNLEKIVINANDEDIYDGLKEIQSTTTQTDPNEIIVITGGKEIYAGDMLTLSIADGAIGQQDIQWTTNSDLVTIETDSLNNAKIYAKKSGQNVTITASYKQNPNVKATIKLNIKSVPTMKTIDYSAFNRCSDLTDLYITSLNPNSIVLASGTSFALSSDVTIWVPKGTKQLYQYHTSWAKYANQIKEVE